MFSPGPETYPQIYPKETIVERSPLRWPNGATVAIAVVVSAEYYEMRPLKDAFIPPNVPGGFGRGPYPDFRVYSARAYGNRIGIFRIFDVLERHGIRPTVAIDALSVELCPLLAGDIRNRGFEVAGHGQAVTRVISERMSESEEDAYIGSSLETLQSAFGAAPLGWHGPEYGESTRTPALLAKHGLQYVLDWPNDEQPFAMSTQSGSLVAVPMAIDLDDVFTQVHRKISAKRWAVAVVDAATRLSVDGENSGRILVLNLHPWLSGHPFRATYLEEMFAAIAKIPGAWLTTTAEIVSCWKAHHAAKAPND
jgi:allantoinase